MIDNIQVYHVVNSKLQMISSICHAAYDDVLYSYSINVGTYYYNSELANDYLPRN